jgi:hypothetical protein
MFLADCNGSPADVTCSRCNQCFIVTKIKAGGRHGGGLLPGLETSDELSFCDFDFNGVDSYGLLAVFQKEIF